MKITIDIKENEKGNVMIAMVGDNLSKATEKERLFAMNIQGVIEQVVPALAQLVGATDKMQNVEQQ